MSSDLEQTREDWRETVEKVTGHSTWESPLMEFEQAVTDYTIDKAVVWFSNDYLTIMSDDHCGHGRHIPISEILETNLFLTEDPNDARALDEDIRGDIDNGRLTIQALLDTAAKIQTRIDALEKRLQR